MNIEDVKRAKSAAMQFIDTYGDRIAPLQTLILLCFVDQKLSHSTATATDFSATAPVPVREQSHGHPQWLLDALPMFAGKKVTSSAILKALGRPSDLTETRQLGVWLREIVGEPKRSNGQTVFHIPGTSPAATAHQARSAEPDIEEPMRADVPLRSRAKTWTIGKQGKFTPAMIATALGIAGTQEELGEIWDGLNEFKFPFEGGAFILGRK